MTEAVWRFRRLHSTSLVEQQQHQRLVVDCVDIPYDSRWRCLKRRSSSAALSVVVMPVVVAVVQAAVVDWADETVVVQPVEGPAVVADFVDQVAGLAGPYEQ
jgi:uncharacterized protein (DUF1786 family)